MLERIAREFEVDVATNKVTCIDLMRANPFDVLVASERLVDGSGLELLSNVATRWPDTLRVLAIEPERRKMLGGKLAPFRLHATIRYPIDEDELERRLAELDRLLGQSDESYAVQEEEAPPPSRGRMPAPPQRVAVTSVRPPAASSAIPAGARSSAANSRPPVAGTARPPAAASQTRAASTPTAAGRSAGTSGVLGRQPAPAAAVGGPKVTPGQLLTGKSYYSAASRAAAELAPPIARPKPGKYTPLGAPEDAGTRIIAREFDTSLAPRAERAMRAREQANREPSATDKARSVAEHVSRTLRRLLKR